jgi:hypothetical protein
MNAVNIQNWRDIVCCAWVRELLWVGDGVVKEADHFLEFLSSFSSKMSFWTCSSLWMRFLLDSLMKPETSSSSRMK